MCCRIVFDCLTGFSTCAAIVAAEATTTTKTNAVCMVYMYYIVLFGLVPVLKMHMAHNLLFDNICEQKRMDKIYFSFDLAVCRISHSTVAIMGSRERGDGRGRTLSTWATVRITNKWKTMRDYTKWEPL